MTKQLEERLGAALHDLADDRTYVPDLGAVERHARRSTRREVLVRSGAGIGAMAVAAAAVGLAATGGSTAKHVPAASPSALDRLATSLAADTALTGDATEVVRTTTNQTGTSVGADLYADDGRYFYRDDPSQLGAAVRGDENLANGVFLREVQAAEYAAGGGDLTTAEQRMAAAALDPGTVTTFLPDGAPVSIPSGLSAVQEKEYLSAHPMQGPAITDDNDVWVNAVDALTAGAGQPRVRAGVLRILSTLPGIAVTPTGGGSTLTISATGTPDTSAGYRESIVIGAADAVPVSFSGGDVGAAPSVTVTYQVKRVTLADLG